MKLKIVIVIICATMLISGLALAWNIGLQNPASSSGTNSSDNGSFLEIPNPFMLSPNDPSTLPNDDVNQIQNDETEDNSEDNSSDSSENEMYVIYCADGTLLTAVG